MLIEEMKYCERCDDLVLARLVRNVAKNGVSQVYWYCLAGRHSTSKSGNLISHAGIAVKDLPIISNYSGDFTCEVCGAPFAELHHWAPRSLFPGEYEYWPKSYLCPDCHNKWHKIVTSK